MMDANARVGLPAKRLLDDEEGNIGPLLPSPEAWPGTRLREFVTRNGLSLASTWFPN